MYDSGTDNFGSSWHECCVEHGRLRHTSVYFN